jgi:WD40 repeat protein
VAYAHSRGIVHRDLKPCNILVGEFGETQVADWGLARRMEDVEHQASTQAAPRIAADNNARADAATASGTPGYMSPEQAAGAAPDPRADVYSLGVVLREIIHGELAEGENFRSGGLVPAELAAICVRALGATPAERYPDAQELAADVARYMDGRRVAAYQYSALDELRRFARAWRAPLAVGAVSIVLLFGLGLWALHRTALERDRATQAELEVRQALVAADHSLGRALVEQSLSALSAESQPEAEMLAARALQLVESPEARGVLAAYARARPKLLGYTPLPRCDHLRLRHDGALLCIDGGVVSLHTGWPPRERWRRQLSASDAAWLPPRHIVVAIHDAGPVRGLLLSEEDGTSRADLPNIAWMRGFVESQGGALMLNPSRLSVIAPVPPASSLAAVPPAVQTMSPCGGIDQHLAAAAAGALVAVACWDGAVVLLDRGGHELRRIKTDRGPIRPGISALALSEDGRSLILATLDGDVLAQDAVTGAEQASVHLTTGAIRRIVPSPTGQRAVLFGDRGGLTVWHYGTGALLLRLPARRDRAVAWASDVELWVAGDDLRHWSLPADMPAARLLQARPPGLSTADLSLDGRRLVLARGDGHVVVLDTTTGAQLLARRPQTGVAKGARFLPGGDVLSWSMGQPSLHRFNSAGAAALVAGLPALRRVALFPSGWLLLLTTGRAARLYGPGDLDLLPGSQGSTPAALAAVSAPPRLQVGAGLFLDGDQAKSERHMALLEEDGTLWLVTDGSPPQARLLLKHHGARCVAISADGTFLAIGDERALELIDIATLRSRGHITSDGQRILDISLSLDGRMLAASDQDGATRVWATNDGRLLAVLRGHDERVASVSFAPGLLATASWDGSARLWDLSVLDRPAPLLRADVEAAWGLDPQATISSR